MIFLECITRQENKWVTAVVIEKPSPDKIRLWIKEWDIMVSWKNPQNADNLTIGSVIPKLGYYYNKNAHGWKSKFVFSPI
jgi:hypothetical protein